MSEEAEGEAPVLLRAWLFGPFVMERQIDGQWVAIERQHWGKGKYTRMLCKRLLCAAGRRLSRGKLLEDLWPDAADRNLDDSAYKLRRLLREASGQSLLQTSNGGYQLADQSLIWTDVDACATLLQEAEQRGRTTAAALPLLEQALHSFERGTFLEDEEGTWCHSLRQARADMLHCCYLWLAEAYETQGHSGQAEQVYSRLLEDDPADEDALCLLLSLLYRQGLSGQARRAYQQTQRQVQQMGLSLSPATEQFVKRLLEQPRSVERFMVPQLPNESSLPTGKQRSELALSSSLSEDIMGGEREERDMDRLRRKLLQYILEITGVSAISPAYLAVSQQVLPATVAIEEFLPQCATSVRTGWQLMNGKELAAAEEILSVCAPSLLRLALQPSTYQPVAANIATQACMLRAIIAKHRLNYVAREMYCHEAVQCSRLSEDHLLQSAALVYLGFTYLVCPPARPKKAIEIFMEALQALSNEDALVRSDIYLGIAEAYSLLREAQQAQEAIALAQDYYPAHPEHDPGYSYLDYPINLLYQWEAKVYLNLGYHQRALEILEQCIRMQSSLRGTSETLIHQADAALGSGDQELYCNSLRQGTQLALELGSQHRYQEAREVYQRTPVIWQDDRRVKELALFFSWEQKR